MQGPSTRRSVLAGIAGATVAPVAAGSASAQSTESEDWETTLETEVELILDDVIVLEDGGLLAVGQDRLEREQYARALRLARDGTVKWSKRIPNDGGERGVLNAAAPALDGGAVAVGYTRGPRDAPVDVAGWIVKIGPDGTVVRQSTIAIEGAMGFQDVTRDGNEFTLVGRRLADADFGAMVAWLDADGTERDRRIIEREEDGPGIEAIATNDSGYCLVGHASGSDGVDTPDTIGYAIGLDRDGAVRWRKTYAGGRLLLFVDVVPDGNGGFVFVGTSFPWSTPETAHWPGQAVRVDGDGSPRWVERFGDAGRNGFRAIERTVNGFIATSDGPIDQDARENDPRLIAIDVNGEVTARTELGDPDGIRRPRAIAIPERGRSVVVGNDSVEPGAEIGFALETATPSETGDGSSGSSLFAPMPGLGVGAALGGLAVGAGLQAARRRSRDD